MEPSDHSDSSWDSSWCSSSVGGGRDSREREELVLVSRKDLEELVRHSGIEWRSRSRSPKQKGMGHPIRQLDVRRCAAQAHSDPVPTTPPDSWPSSANALGPIGQCTVPRHRPWRAPRTHFQGYQILNTGGGLEFMYIPTGSAPVWTFWRGQQWVWYPEPGNPPNNWIDMGMQGLED